MSEEPDTSARGWSARNGLSIDLEDWFHAELVRRHLRTEAPACRIEWTVEPILGLLKKYGVRATFFVLGDVIRRHPELVRRIYDEGHEIGCHGWSHRPLWALAPERLRQELDDFDHDASAVLPVEEIVGFRAPTFSLDKETSWALDVLQERGFRYDSSIFPLRTGLYGVQDAPLHPYRPSARRLTHDHSRGELVEFPLTVCDVAGFRIPVAGGVYLRVLPLMLIRVLLRRVNQEGRPFVIYFHPWEADLATPKLAGMPWLSRVATHINAGTVLPKVEALLREFPFAPLRDVLAVPDRRAARAEIRRMGTNAMDVAP